MTPPDPDMREMAITVDEAYEAGKRAGMRAQREAAWLQGEDVGMTCRWCAREFAGRRTGGRRQLYCSSQCRRTMEAAARDWLAAQIAAGLLTSAMLRAYQSNPRVGTEAVAP
jgi:hypothetical protein